MLGEEKKEEWEITFDNTVRLQRNLPTRETDS